MSDILLDGAAGEGGGQILRSALSLSLVTGRAFRIVGIRAGRSRPGLLAQHLTAVRAAALVGAAEVEGDTLGSQALSFRPQGITAGDWRFATGTAGSAMLVYQTVLPALLRADGPSTLWLEGGTHNPAAPPFEFLDRTFLPCLRRMGAEVTLHLERAGFFPRGGGRVRGTVVPRPLGPLTLLERGPTSRPQVEVLLADLDPDIARREAQAAAHALKLEPEAVEIVRWPGWGPGNAVLVTVGDTTHREVFTSFGQRGVRAEEVARIATRAAQDHLASDAPVGEFLADQLLLPLALAGGGAFRTSVVSEHTRTHVEVIRRFLDLPIEVRPDGRRAWRVQLG